jgi:hypothetical protein
MRDRLPQILREAQIFLWVQYGSATGVRPRHKLRPNAPQRVNHPFGREASGQINGIYIACQKTLLNFFRPNGGDTLYS